MQTRGYQPGTSRTRGPMPGSRKLASAQIVKLLDAARETSLHGVARACGVSYPTVCNAVDGGYMRSGSWDKITAFLAARGGHAIPQ